MKFRKNTKKNSLTLIDIYAKYLKKIPSRLLDKKDVQIICSKQTSKRYLFFKRICDLIFSILIFLITSPIIVLTGLMIKIEDGGPIFYSQIRNGLDNKPYKIIKIRSMIVNAEEIDRLLRIG